MWIISPRCAREFWELHPEAESPLRHWLAIVRNADWKTPATMSGTFPSADRVKVDSGRTVWVFNVGGNNYRLIAAIHFNIGKLFILRILNHRDYDREAWKKEL